jgi:hypothetical protein
MAILTTTVTTTGADVLERFHVSRAILVALGSDRSSAIAPRRGGFTI